MKKVLKELLCFVTLMGVSVGYTNAATIAIGDDTTGAGAINKSVSVELQDDDLKDYTKVEFELSVSGTSYATIDFSYKGSMTYSPNGNVYTISAESGLYASTIGVVNYKTSENLNSNFKITPTNVKFYKADGTVNKPGDSGVKIKEGSIKYEEPKSNDATLKELEVSQGTLTPEFDSDTTEYKVTVADTINSLKLSATAADGATRTGVGNKILDMGENIYEIVVTAADGKTTKTYTITINRGTTSEPSAYLKSLSVNNIGCKLSPKFDKMNTIYTVDAPSDITELDLKYELEDEAATVSIEGNEDFKIGENLITINVKSSDGEDEQTYEITVNIEEEEKKEELLEEVKSEPKKKNPWIIVIIVIVCLFIIGGVAFLLFGKKASKNNKKKDNLPRQKTILDDDDDFEEKKESITEELKHELYNDDATTTFDKRKFAQEEIDENDLEKTKEFNFKDFN